MYDCKSQLEIKLYIIQKISKYRFAVCRVCFREQIYISKYMIHWKVVNIDLTENIFKLHDSVYVLYEHQQWCGWQYRWSDVISSALSRLLLWRL